MIIHVPQLTACDFNQLHRPDQIGWLNKSREKKIVQRPVSTSRFGHRARCYAELADACAPAHDGMARLSLTVR